MPVRVLHLTGSATSDFLADLSLLYARDCWSAVAEPARYEMLAAFVAPDGSWRFPADLSAGALAAARPVPLATAVDILATTAPDLVVPQMFCVPGMTTYRALLEALGLPYVGNRPAVMALGADKAHARAVVAAAGVAVPAGEVLRRGETPTLPPPVVVKPVDSDNSVGISLVRAVEDYDAALAGAFAHAERVLVETYVELGREVRCGVLEQDGQLVCLPLEEYAVDPVTKPIRDAADKLGRDDAGGLDLMAKTADRAWTVDPADELTERVWAAARLAHRALDCRHYSLFDFRIDPAGRPWFLEAGLYCSFARRSVVPMMAAAAGTPLPELFSTMVRQALQ